MLYQENCHINITLKYLYRHLKIIDIWELGVPNYFSRLVLTYLLLYLGEHIQGLFIE